jgi:hypothetical protein
MRVTGQPREQIVKLLNVEFCKYDVGSTCKWQIIDEILVSATCNMLSNHLHSKIRRNPENVNLRSGHRSPESNRFAPYQKKTRYR